MGRWTVGKIRKIIEQNKISFGEYMIIRDVENIKIQGKWLAIQKGVEQGEFEVEELTKNCYKVKKRLQKNEVDV